MIIAKHLESNVLHKLHYPFGTYVAWNCLNECYRFEAKDDYEAMKIFADWLNVTHHKLERR